MKQCALDGCTETSKRRKFCSAEHAAMYERTNQTKPVHNDEQITFEELEEMNEE